jgi:hypothetical protein
MMNDIPTPAFVTTTDAGGPHDAESYRAGFEMGLLQMSLIRQSIAADLLGNPSLFDPLLEGFVISAANQPQADLIAMAAGYVATFSEIPGHLELMRMDLKRGTGLERR